MKLILTITFYVCLPFWSHAQGIKGTITDDKKVPIPFASIYIQNLQTGTNSNVKGEYEFTIKPGTYKVTFRSLGYKQVTREIVIKNIVEVLNVELPTEVYQIKEVIITKGDEDPAYPIMRKVIAWAPYHSAQVKHYKSDVYLKGTMLIDNIPSLIKNKVAVGGNGKYDKIKTGDVYLGESVNEILFNAPDKYAQHVKSSQSSFPNVGNDAVAPIDFIKSSLYQSNIVNCISPCAPEAFGYYKFIYEGYFEEGEYIINKIRVEPRRKSQQLFSGYLYIVDQYWSIQSADLLNEQFWGTLKISQLCVPLKQNAWLPVSYNFHFTFSMLGFKARYLYSSSVKYSDIKIDEKLTGPKIPKTVVAEHTDSITGKKKAIDSDLQTILSKDKLSFRDMRKLMKASRKEQRSINPDTVKSLEVKPRENYTIDPEAKKHDSLYWAQTRAIPLTNDELKSYHRKDSIIRKLSNDTTKADGKKHKSKLVRKILSGFSVPSNDSSLWFGYGGILKLGGISFNTVDGWLYKQSFNVSLRLDSTHSLWLSPELKYAFNRRELMGYFTSGLNYAPMKNGKFILAGGVNSLDFNQNNGIKAFENSVSSLFFRENYMKLYERKFLDVSNEIDLANGLKLNTAINFAEMRTLKNHSDFSFFYQNKRTYSPNIPDNDFFIFESPLKNSSFTMSADLTYTPEFHYLIEKHSKRMLWSKYPTFDLSYKTAINGVFQSDSKYHLIEGGVKQKINLKYGASLNYNFLFGSFFNVGRIHFSEFRHFNTQPLPVTLSTFEQSFQLLDFYKYSTSERFIEGHVHYETQLLLLKYLPFVGFTNWSENIYINYLSTPILKNHMEFGYGLNNIALLANLGIFTSFENGRYKSVGAKVSINFGN